MPRHGLENIKAGSDLIWFATFALLLDFDFITQIALTFLVLFTVTVGCGFIFQILKAQRLLLLL
jgi:hypothetical protein